MTLCYRCVRNIEHCECPPPRLPRGSDFSEGVPPENEPARPRERFICGSCGGATDYLAIRNNRTVCRRCL